MGNVMPPVPELKISATCLILTIGQPFRKPEQGIPKCGECLRLWQAKIHRPEDEIERVL